MILLGQHGQRQDYHMGLEYVRLAAQSCDQNAPQGAYVSPHSFVCSTKHGPNQSYRFTVCFWRVSFRK